jgi:hypothetical protein
MHAPTRTCVRTVQTPLDRTEKTRTTLSHETDLLHALALICKNKEFASKELWPQVGLVVSTMKVTLESLSFFLFSNFFCKNLSTRNIFQIFL